MAEQPQLLYHLPVRKIQPHRDFFDDPSCSPTLVGLASLKLLRNEDIVTVHADTHTCELQHPSDSCSVPGRIRKQGAFPPLCSPSGDQTSPARQYFTRAINSQKVAVSPAVQCHRSQQEQLQELPNRSQFVFSPCFLSSLNCLAR